MNGNRRQVLGGGGALALVTASGVSAAAKFDPAVALASLAAAAGREPFNGALLVAGPGARPRRAAIGLANIEASRPISPATPFGIASITKFLTTLAILKLVEERRMALDAPITALLKDYRRDTGDKVTLGHLLSNTSGIPNGYIAAVKLDASLMSLDLPMAEAIRRYASGDLAFEPGSKFDYSLTNWILVRALVEAAAAAPFEEVVASRVLRPLGMKGTGRLLPSMIDPVAAPYRTIDPPARNLQLNPAFAVASGGYCSTVGDLHRLAIAVFERRFLSPASLKLLTTVRVAEQNYALGGRIKTLVLAGAERRFAWETGNSGGYKCLMAHGLDGGPTLVLLNNTNLSQKRVDEIAIAALNRGYGPA
ncbi:MAG TPA: serine hydrolase domain-containing protein [Caulobacter sp.]|nr:serine hydrolase domain-containing protein [Caulobacter sp.]